MMVEPVREMELRDWVRVIQGDLVFTGDTCGRDLQGRLQGD